MDFYSDRSHRVFHILRNAIKSLNLEKLAQQISLEDKAHCVTYADPLNKTYPLYSAESTILSAAYAAYHNDENALRNIKTASEFWGVRDYVDRVIQEVQQHVRPVKYAVDFTLQNKQYKFFGYDGPETISTAVRDFYEHRHKFPWGIREKAAKEFYADIFEYGGPEKTKIRDPHFTYIKQASGFLIPSYENAQAMIFQRMNAKNRNHEAFLKIAEIIRELEGTPGWDKIAMQAFDELDNVLKIKNQYGVSLRLPEEDLYLPMAQQKSLDNVWVL